MRALIVDDHIIMRAGMKSVLEKIDELTVVGEAGTAEKAVLLAREIRPDIIFMDIELPGQSGISATREIVQNRWCERVVMVSAFDSPDFVRSAFDAGASGYVLKAGGSEEIVAAIEEVSRGGQYLTPMLSVFLGEGGLAPGAQEDSPIARLSPREREVLVHIAEGRASKQIAVELGVSHRTVETHRTNLMRKLGVKKASELVRIAIREGLIVA
ncbi:MAG: response regulator transcription factor [Myxococcota bacterium]|jgi:DNA-binding NarL/FixJ family response regulator|nr:response regulator transcription factor [Myxococcota bacterium]